MLTLDFNDLRALLRDSLDYFTYDRPLAAPIHCQDCGRQWPGNIQALHRFCPGKALSYSRSARRTSRRRSVKA